MTFTNSFNFQSIIFNHGIAQKFMRGFVERFACVFLVGGVEFDLQIFADVDSFDAAMAHVFEGFQDGDALRVNDGFFRGDDDFCFHARAKRFCGKNFGEARNFSKSECRAKDAKKNEGENFPSQPSRSSRDIFEALNFSARCAIVHA